jgi:hypothetical protein
LLETAEAKLEVVHIDPERTFDASARPNRKMLAWLASGHLDAGAPVAAHDPREAGRIFGSRNPGPERASVFLCTL